MRDARPAVLPGPSGPHLSSHRPGLSDRAAEAAAGVSASSAFGTRFPVGPHGKQLRAQTSARLAKGPPDPWLGRCCRRPSLCGTPHAHDCPVKADFFVSPSSVSSPGPSLSISCLASDGRCVGCSIIYSSRDMKATEVSTDDAWVKQRWSGSVTEYYAARNKATLPLAPPWVDLVGMMRSEITQTKHKQQV